MVKIFAQQILEDLDTLDKLKNDRELTWFEDLRIDSLVKFEQEG